MNFKIKIKKILFYIFILIIIISSCYPMTTYAEELPTIETDKMFLSHYTQLYNKCNYIYKVSVEMEIKGKEAMIPPTLLTFVLDGTASMDALDGTLQSRDTKVREAMVEAFRVLMTQDLANQQNTFINIISFGSTGNKSISLTDWASSPTPLLNDLKNPNSSFFLTQGSSQEFIPLLNPTDNTKLNPILAQLFYCDYDTLDLKPAGIPSTLDSAYPISRQYFYGNDQASEIDGLGLPSKGYSSRFPFHSWGTAINGGMRRAYYSLKDEITTIKADPNYTQAEIENMKKYVMVLCDGDDATANGTQSYAAAIKAPENITIPTFEMMGGGRTTSNVTIPLTTPSITTPNLGLNTEIWSMVIGLEGYLTPTAIATEDAWKTNYLTNGLSGAISAFARNMISIAAAPVVNWSSFSSNTIPTNWANYYTQYQANLDAGKFADTTNYLRTIQASEAKTYFAKFALRADPAVGADKVIAKGNIPTYFLPYGLTDPLYQPTTFSSNAEHIPKITISANGQLLWDIGIMDPGEKVQLVYYMQIKPEFQGNDLWYNSMERFSVSYAGASGDFLNINLPETLIHSAPRDADCPETTSLGIFENSNGSNNSMNNPDLSEIISLDGNIPGNGSTESNNTSNSTSEGKQLDAVPAPYTASVMRTKAPLKLKDETIEEGVEEIPITGYKSIIFLFILGICLLAIYTIIKSKRPY